MIIMFCEVRKMYGVLQKNQKKASRVKKNDGPQVKPCPKCGEDFVKMHAYTFNPLSIRNGPKPWSDRKDNNF